MAQAVLRSTNLLDGAEKVAVYTKYADWFQGGDPIKTASVGDGEVKITGLDLDQAYWAQSDNGTVVSFVAKDPPQAKQALKPAEIRERLKGTVPTTVEVPLDDYYAKGQLSRLQETGKEADPQPRIKQQDVPKGTPQRSATPIGEGHPVDPEEPQPTPRQEDVAGTVPQRSDTPTGEATVIPKGELQPAPSQDDVKGPQRSDTEEGSAEPTPKTKAQARKATEARDASVTKNAPQVADPPVALDKASKQAKGKR